MCVWALRGIGADPAFFLGGELLGAGPGGEPANAGWGEGRVGRRRGRRERRKLPEAAPGDRGDHQLRARPSLALALAGRARARRSRPSLPPPPAMVTGADVRLPGRRGSAWCGSRSRRAPGQSAPEADLLATEISAAPTVAAGFAPTAPGSTPWSTCACPAATTSRTRSPRSAGSARRLRRRRVREGARRLPGVSRRFELKGERNGARIYDDYAHHPTEVSATLEAARELGPRRLIAAFQPHLYSRTKALAAEFGAALAGGRRGRGPRRLPGARGARWGPSPG